MIFLQQSISLNWFESFQQGSTLNKKAVDICSDSGLSLQTGAFCSANNSPLDFSRPCAEGEKHHYRKRL